MKKYLILLLIFTSHAYSFEYPYNTLDKSFITTPNTEILVPNLTPIKAQDGVGVCYGFTATTLLEHYRCRELNLDCSKPSEVLSSLDVTSYYGEKKNSLKQGGTVFSSLTRISAKTTTIAREECIPFNSMVHQMQNVRGTKKNEEVGWRYLELKWQEYKGINKAANDCVTCLATDIKKNIAGIKTPAEQISEAFSTSSDLEEFLYKSILPKECLEKDKAAFMPPFTPKSFPDLNREQTAIEDISEAILVKKVTDLLSAQTPVEMGICADKKWSPDCEDNEGHSITLVGIKEACGKTPKECRKMVLVRNSYGKNWQDRTNGGWIDLEEVVKSSLALTKFRNITWIEKAK